MSTAKNQSQVIGEIIMKETTEGIILTVPTSTNVVAGQKYWLVKQAEGTLSYHPVNDNPWWNGDYDDIDFRAELDKVGNFGLETPVGKELRPVNNHFR